MRISGGESGSAAIRAYQRPQRSRRIAGSARADFADTLRGKRLTILASFCCSWFQNAAIYLPAGRIPGGTRPRVSFEHAASNSEIACRNRCTPAATQGSRGEERAARPISPNAPQGRRSRASCRSGQMARDPFAAERGSPRAAAGAVFFRFLPGETARDRRILALGRGHRRAPFLSAHLCRSALLHARLRSHVPMRRLRNR